MSPLTFEELYHQAAAARVAARKVAASYSALRCTLPFSRYTDIIFTGCGSSYHLAQCAAIAWAAMLERPCRALPASELVNFGSAYLDREAQSLLFAISRTGGTDETILAVRSLTSNYHTTSIAVTTEAGSELGSACSLDLALTECAERSIVTTQGFTCMLYALLILADKLTGDRHSHALAIVPDLIADALTRSEPVTRALGEDSSLEHFVFLGSGPFLGLASESALKMAEISLSLAQSFPILEFRHGPKALLDSRMLVTLFPARAERRYMDAMCREILATGARVLVVGEDPLPSAARDTGMRTLLMGAGLEEFFQPALFAHVAQQIAFWRSRKLGLNADAPPHLVRTVKLNG